MKPTLTILRNRRQRRSQPDRRLEQGGRSVLFGCGFLLSVGLLFLLFSTVLTYQSITHDLPSLQIMDTLLNPRDGQLLQPTRILDRSGEHLVQVFAPEDAPRRYIPLAPENPQHLPESLVRATLALADPGFWSHPGYRLSGLTRPDQHPTLTQRLVADLLLWNEKPTIRRALRERLLAAQLIQTFGRQQILEWWLNSADFGQNAYGAEAAAQLYFGKSVTELDLAESATLAAASQSPALNPIDAPTAAYQRRQETLHIMAALGMAEPAEVDAALRTPFNVLPPNDAENPAPAFTRYLMDQLAALYPRERIERGGLTILSSLDLDLQAQTQCAVRTQVARLGNVQTTPCSSAWTLPALPAGTALHHIQASALILDPENGQVLAAVGETGLNGEAGNLAAHRAGSSLTPFIYLTGFTRGLSPASLLWDIPSENGIRNFDGSYHGPLRLRTALANDYLVPAQGVLAQMGADNVTRIARSFGLDFDAQDFRQVTVDLPVLARAYGVFAADGVSYGQSVGGEIVPTALLEMRAADGSLWLDWHTPQAQPVVTPQLAYLVNDVLSDEIARWPTWGTPSVLELKRPGAVKVSRTADAREFTALGYAPQRVVAVWVGADEALPQTAAAGLWRMIFDEATRTLPPQGWDTPLGVTRMDVCDPSGLLPTADCPNVVSEVFLNGSEPSQYDNLYRTFEINRETGFLATVFTPPELIETQTFLIVPAEAKAWTKLAGLATPPETYDAIQPPPRLPDAYLTVPNLFANVSGTVEIGGTASGEDFAYYRVLVGEGLNPQAWVQIGEDVREPLRDNLLAVWDTNGLNGLYAIQLMVVRTDGRVDLATTQVSVDNEGPTVRIIAPREKDVFDLADNRQLTFVVQASDNLGVETVDFYIDFQQVGTVTEAPYQLTWITSAGNHHLKVVARDRAGNIAEDVVRFKVEK